jgi:hypothetical protein
VVVARARGATVSSEQARQGFAAVYYPGTTNSALAQRFVITAGEDVAGLNLVFPPVATYTVTGTVVDGNGRPFAGSVNLVPSARSGAVPVDTHGTTIRADGTFVIADVPPGEYAAKATVARPGDLGTFGMEYVTITDRSPAPIRITVSGGSTITGRVILETAGDDLQRLAISADSADADFAPNPSSRAAAFTRNADLTFRVTDAFGPIRLLTNPTPGCEGCYLKAARVNGIDTLQTPVDVGLRPQTFQGAEVVMSDAGASIEGRAMASPGRLAANYRVAIIPVGREQWFPNSPFVKSNGSDDDGTFRITGIPPGDYVVVAVSRLDTGLGGGEINDRELLEALSQRGTRVTLAEHDKKAVELTLIRR